MEGRKEEEETEEELVQMSRTWRGGDYLMGGSSLLLRRRKRRGAGRGGGNVVLGWVWWRLLDEGQLLVVAHVHVVVHGVRARVGRRHGHRGAVILRLQPQGSPPITPPAEDEMLGR